MKRKRTQIILRPFSFSGKSNLVNIVFIQFTIKRGNADFQ